MVFELFDRRALSGSASTCARRAACAGKNRGLVAPCPHRRARSGLPGSTGDLVWYLGCFVSKRGDSMRGCHRLHSGYQRAQCGHPNADRKIDARADDKTAWMNRFFPV